MKEFNIRKELPSIKVNKELIGQLENYILSDVPQIINIEKNLVADKYSLEIVDSLGSGKFNSITEFPLTIFQDGTEKIKFGFGIYSQPYISISISLSKSKYHSELDISINTQNPREKAQGIYNGILDIINQHKTYNYIFHGIYMPIISGLSGLLISPIITQVINKNFIWASYLILACIIINFIGIRLGRYKPYSEFFTNKQMYYNRIFSFFIWGIISYFIFGLGFGFLKDSVIK